MLLILKPDASVCVCGFIILYFAIFILLSVYARDIMTKTTEKFVLKKTCLAYVVVQFGLDVIY